MDDKKIKIAMAIAVSKAFGYKNELEELGEILDVNWSGIYQKMLPEIEQTNDKKIRMAMIAAISKALKYSQENPTAKEKHVLQHVIDESDSILDAISKSG